jgi:hypothetical protein
MTKESKEGMDGPVKPGHDEFGAGLSGDEGFAPGQEFAEVG